MIVDRDLVFVGVNLYRYWSYCIVMVIHRVMRAHVVQG